MKFEYHRYYSKPRQYGAFAQNTRWPTASPVRMWKIGPFDSWDTAQTAIRLCWGAYGSDERERKAIGYCQVDDYNRPERYKDAAPWPGVT